DVGRHYALGNVERNGLIHPLLDRAFMDIDGRGGRGRKGGIHIGFTKAGKVVGLNSSGESRSANLLREVNEESFYEVCRGLWDKMEQSRRVLSDNWCGVARSESVSQSCTRRRD